MELWIRSQDKRVLVKINDIRLNILDNKEILGNFIRITDTQNDYEKLGTYETKERALEILDEIQNILKPQEYEIEKGNGYYTKSTNISTYVYKMPED